MKVSQRQIESVCALPGAKRYEHFLKLVADWEEVWGLYLEGWTSAATDDGQLVFPVWPAEAYAALCVGGEWSGYEPKSFSLDDFMDLLLPRLEKEGALIGVFYTPADKGVVRDFERIRRDLNIELDNY